MSFGDISAKSSSGGGPIVKKASGFEQLSSNSEKDSVSILRNSISNFQKSCMSVKDKITEMRRRKVSVTEKNQLDLQIRELKHQENAIKLQFDAKQKELDRLSKQDAALQKAALAKLYKDYERLKGGLEAISSEAQLVKPEPGSGGSSDSFARTGTGNIMLSVEEQGDPHDNTIVVNNGGQRLVLKPIVQANDVDDMIIEEREKEIKKLHDDLVLVNDMYMQMADIVQKQGVQVDHVHKTTEDSHQRAEAGLEQVKQAANYQPTCILS